MFQGSKLQCRILPDCIFALQACSEIIIGRCTPEVGSQFATVFHHLHSVHIVAAEIAVVSVEIHREVFAFDGQVILVVIQNTGYGDCLIGSLSVFQLELRSFIVTNAQLLVCDGCSCG